jgi:hypothetical protein
MKLTQDPWTIRKDRKPNKLKRTNEEPDSPGRKRVKRDDSSDSGVLSTAVHTAFMLLTLC